VAAGLGGQPGRLSSFARLGEAGRVADMGRRAARKARGGLSRFFGATPSGWALSRASRDLGVPIAAERLNSTYS
jgi:hypothetical protein